MSHVVSEANSLLNSSSSPIPLSNTEVIQGLKEALSVGTKNSVIQSSKLDGFYKNPDLFIPFPPEVIKVKEKIELLGMKPQVDKFVLTLNRAAETASKEATPIFIEAIKGMSISDGFSILKGDKNAATLYLKEKTSAKLSIQFKPIVQAAIKEVEVTKYWNPVISNYNKIPFIEKQNANLEDYVTQEAMNGLFLMIEKEEEKIRQDPTARVTDILKRVFSE
jgi:hypothetical protein